MPSNKKQGIINAHNRHIEEAQGRARQSFEIACSPEERDALQIFHALKSIGPDVETATLWQERLAGLTGQPWTPPADPCHAVIGVAGTEIADRLRRQHLLLATDELQGAFRRSAHHLAPSLLDDISKHLRGAGYTDETMDEGFAALGTSRAALTGYDEGHPVTTHPVLLERKSTLG